MNVQDIIIVGARINGQAGAVIDTLEDIGGYRLIGFIDNTLELQEKLVCGVPVIGSTEDLETLEIPECSLHIAIGDNESRFKIFQILKKRKFKVATLVHPFARVSKHATIGEGCFVSVNAVIRNGATVGCASIVNTSAIVEHDNKIGKGVHIGPGVHTGGCVHIEDYSFIGLGSSILPDIKIGSGTVIGAGSTITKNVPSNVIMIGEAAKIYEKNN